MIPCRAVPRRTTTGAARCIARLEPRFRGPATGSNPTFVAFVNEEPPFFHLRDGEPFYARECHRRGDRIVAMLSLETIGYYREESGSQ
jgi:hypothetical protein